MQVNIKKYLENGSNVDEDKVSADFKREY